MTSPENVPNAAEEPTASDECATDDEARKQRIALQYVKEVTILLVGVFIGFFWSQYFQRVSNEAHLIVALSLVVLCLVRYIYLTRK